MFRIYGSVMKGWRVLTFNWLAGPPVAVHGPPRNYPDSRPSCFHHLSLHRSLSPSSHLTDTYDQLLISHTTRGNFLPPPLHSLPLLFIFPSFICQEVEAGMDGSRDCRKYKLWRTQVWIPPLTARPSFPLVRSSVFVVHRLM